MDPQNLLKGSNLHQKEHNVLMFTDTSEKGWGVAQAPFEPLGKADLKILTFKTVFLLALASGKRRSEIHAWTSNSFSRNRDWSEVTFSPSTAFIAKNQLASEGPLAIQPVVIPALKPTLDPSLIQDRSLCPVRALRYYLDKTKDLRKGKKLLFVAIKGHRQRFSQKL